MGQSYRQWRLLATGLSVVLGAFVLHFLLYVGPREGAIDRRNARALAAMANLVGNELGHLIDILDKAAAPGGPRTCTPAGDVKTAVPAGQPSGAAALAESLQQRLRSALESNDALSVTVSADPQFSCGSSPSTALAAPGNRHLAVLTLTRTLCLPDAQGAAQALRINAELRLDRLLPRRAASADRLDQLLVIDGERRVLHQDAGAGEQLSELSKAESKSGPSAPEALFGWSAHRSTLSAGGHSYFAYEQPISSVPGVSGDAAALHLRMVGLVEVDHFTRERFALPVTFTLGVVCLLLFVLLSWPFLKLILIGARERLRAIDGQLLFFAVIACAGLATILCQDYFYLKEEGRRREQRLASLASGVDASLESELRAGHALLAGFARKLALEPGYPTCRTDVSASELMPAGTPPQLLAAFQTLYRVNAAGDQVAKWVASRRMTPLLALADRAYVHDTRAGRFVAHLPATGTRPAVELHVEPVRSHNSAQKLTVLSIPLAGMPAGTTDTLHLSTELASLTDPLLQLGYGFAVVDRAGQVKYHSDARKSLEESFLDEADGDYRLRAALQHGTTGPLAVEYAGEPTLLYLTPLSGLPWTLIAYETDELHETVNLEIAITSLSCFGLYLLFLGCVRFAVFVVTGSPRSEWMWPEVRGSASASGRHAHGQGRGSGSRASAAGGSRTGALLARLWLALGAARARTPAERSVAQLQCALVLGGQLLAFVLMLVFGGALGVFWASLALPLLALTSSYLVLEPSTRLRSSRTVARCMALGASLVLAYAFACPSRPGGSALLALGGALSIAGSAALALMLERWAWLRAWLAPGSRMANAAYVASGLLLVGIAGCGPAWAMFEDAARIEHAARLGVMQRQFVDALEQRAAALERRQRAEPDSEAVKTFVDAHLPAFGQPASGARRERFLARWTGAYPLFDADIGAQPGTADRPLQANCEWFSARHFTCPIWRHLPCYSAVTSELRAAAAPVRGKSFVDANGQHAYYAEADFGVLGHKRVKISEPRSQPLAPAWLESWDALGLVLLLCAAFLGVVRVTAVRLFGLRAASFPRPAQGSDGAETSEPQAPLCIHFMPPATVRGRMQAQRKMLDFRELESLGRQPHGTPLWVEHLEHCFGDAARTARALELLEQWVYLDRCSLHLEMLADPLYFLSEWRNDALAAGSKPEQLPNIERWATLLAGFDRLHYERPEYQPTSRASAASDPEARQQALCLIEQECGWDETLHAIGRRLEQRCATTELNEDELLLLLANACGPRHRQLWSLCTREEQLLLARVSVEGYVNPRAWAVARRLERRGLLRRDPAYRLASESLRMFVAHAMHPEELERIESQERSTWMRLSLPLLLLTGALAAFVLWSQPAFTNTLFAVIGASAAGFAALIRLVVAVRQGRSQLGEFRG